MKLPMLAKNSEKSLGGRTEELDFVMRDEQERAQNEGKQNISPYIERLQVLYESGEIDDTTMESEWISECVRLYAKGECLKTTRDFVKTLFAD